MLPDDDDLPVPLRGLPLTSNPFAPNQLNNTDTLVARTSGLDDGQSGRIEAELVALSLMSVAPVEISGSFFDVFVTLDSQNRSFGFLDVTHNDPVGGTFDSFFDVFTKITIVPVGGVTPVMTAFRSDPISSDDTPWSHTLPPGYPYYPADGTVFDIPSGDPIFFSGNFFPGVLDGRLVVIHHTGPHPDTTLPNPEPGTLLLFASGLAGVLGLGLRRKLAQKA